MATSAPTIVTELKDLADVQLTVRVKVGWRVVAAKWLILLAKWIGGCQVEFLGDAHQDADR